MTNSTLPTEYDSPNIQSLFLGRRIVSSESSEFGDVIYRLDNGSFLKLIPNEGCPVSSCGNGNFEVIDFTKFDRVISGVTIIDDEGDYTAGEATLELFVYGEGISEKIASVKGSEGNGYYGRGFKLQVTERR